MKIYRAIRDGDTLVGLQDEISKSCIPISTDNSDYTNYLKLLELNLALLLEAGEALPDGVTSTQEAPPHAPIPHA